jgi:hypothetical protein
MIAQWIRFSLLAGFCCMSGIIMAGPPSPIKCSNTYALCSAASCQPIPGQDNKVLCHCSVWEGENAGFSSCEQRKPKVNKQGFKTLTSTFSLGGGHFQYMTCSAKSLWADCLDQPCLVDEKLSDKRHAVCTCNLKFEPNWVTFAGECDTNKCSRSVPGEMRQILS